MSEKKQLPLVAVWRNCVRDSNLDRTAKLVAYTLSTYMDFHGVASPAKVTLARGASLGHNPGNDPGQRKGNTAVDGAIDRLEACGLLVVERRRGQVGFRYGAAIPRWYEGLKSHADARDNGYSIPRGHDAESLAESARIPRPGVGESAESAESVSLVRAPRAKTKVAHADAREDLTAYDRG